MRVTKRMKEFVEEQVRNEMYAKNKADREGYEARKEAADEEIKVYLAEVNKRIAEIAKKHSLDVEVDRYGSKTEIGRAVLSYSSSYLTNAVEVDAIKNRERERNKAVSAMIEKFLLECDLGMDKDEFYASIEDMKKNIQ